MPFILRLLRLLLVVCLLSYRSTSAMDVDWVPNDENAPLPLSNAYRENLRKLCDLITSGNKLPPNLIEKKAILEKQCAKLRKDDANVNDAAAGGSNYIFLISVASTTLMIGLLNTDMFQNGIDKARTMFRRWRAKNNGQGYKTLRGGAIPDMGDLAAEGLTFTAKTAAQTVNTGSSDPQSAEDYKMERLKRYNQLAAATTQAILECMDDENVKPDPSIKPGKITFGSGLEHLR